MSYRSILAETVTFVGYNGDSGEAYYARPTTDGKFPGIVVIHHMPGWDEWIIEVVRKFAHHGYAAIAPHLYFRNGPGSLSITHNLSSDDGAQLNVREAR
jgi:carboxymethylenebutenolidase